MTIDFILNGEDVVVRADAERRLIDILKDLFHLEGAKHNCCNGRCGLCSVILNGDVVNSCMTPAFKIRGCEVITIEGFSQTTEYQDIAQAFANSGVKNCGYCDTGKILTTEALVSKNPRPGRAEILKAFNNIRCRCTEPESLVQGVLAVAEIRQRRLYGRRS